MIEAPATRPIVNDHDALEQLGDTPFLLYCARQAAKLFWSLACKRWPELRGIR